MLLHNNELIQTQQVCGLRRRKTGLRHRTRLCLVGQAAKEKCPGRAFISDLQAFPEVVRERLNHPILNISCQCAGCSDGRGRPGGRVGAAWEKRYPERPSRVK